MMGLSNKDIVALSGGHTLGPRGTRNWARHTFAQVLQPILQELTETLAEKHVIIIQNIKIINGSKLKKANDEKMSKSLKNFTIREVTKLYHPLALRHFLLGTHYLSLYAPSLMIGAAVEAVFGGSAGELINSAIPGNAAIAQPQAYALGNTLSEPLCT